MADLRAAHRQIEDGPRVAARVEPDDAVRGPQVAPHPVLAVDRDVIRLHRGIRQRDDRRLERLGVDLRPRSPVRIAHPQEVGVLVGAHAARTLRPRQGSVEAEVADGLVEGAICAEQAIDLDVGYLDLDRFAGGDVALVDGVHRHLRPPAVAVAIRSEEHTLNSSHITISYAVFCLKKKKKKIKNYINKKKKKIKKNKKK